MIKFNSASHRPARQYHLKERSENLRIGTSSKKQSKNAIKQRQHNIQKDSSLDNRLHTFFNLLRTIAGDVGLRKVQDRVAGEEANVNLKRCKYARKYGNSDMISLISDEQRLKNATQVPQLKKSRKHSQSQHKIAAFADRC